MSTDNYHKSIQDYRNELRSSTVAPGSESRSRGAQSLEETLDRLADVNTAPEQRTGALLLLKAQALSHSSFSEWRPLFLDALRSASDSENKPLRELAFETLTSYEDKETQQRILDGLMNPSVALIPKDFALRLLSQDPHSSAHEAARLYAEDDSDEAVRLEALRVLASDPGSVERFAALLIDGNQPEEIRTLAATALSSLDRGRLGTAAASMASRGGALETMSESNIGKHVRALLELQK